MYPRPMEWWALPGMVEEFADFEQFWDNERTVSADVKRRIVPAFDGEIPWDMFILFETEARWTTAGEHVTASGYTVLHTQAELFAALGDVPRRPERLSHASEN